MEQILDRREQMNLLVTTFPHHRSLALQTQDLLTWIEELKGRDERWKKWDGPGFFPHVILKSRYARDIEQFTGLVQFDIDDASYLKQYTSRETLLDSLRIDHRCIMAYPSFSEFGIWGVFQGLPTRNAEEFRTMAFHVTENLEEEFSVRLDRRVSLEPRAFRLVPPMKS